MIKQVFRIQHPFDKKGLWRSYGGLEDAIIYQHSKVNEIVERHTLANGFPTPYSDDKLRVEMSRDNTNLEMYKFAFHSLEQLERALTNEELKEFINKLGFQVLIFDVEDFYESEYQVIYRAGTEKNVKDISSMFL